MWFGSKVAWKIRLQTQGCWLLELIMDRMTYVTVEEVDPLSRKLHLCVQCWHKKRHDKPLRKKALFTGTNYYKLMISRRAPEGLIWWFPQHLRGRQLCLGFIHSLNNWWRLSGKFFICYEISSRFSQVTEALKKLSMHKRSLTAIANGVDSARWFSTLEHAGNSES